MPDIPIQSLQVFGDDPDRYARQIFTDSLVKQTRDATPPDVANQRATPRLSIGELNSLDLPAIKTRYQSTKLDSRGPVTRFLDLLDLPRNAIANIIFPGEAAAMKESGETGTFGMGKVTFSDALRKMGVENRVALAVGGFVGDVLMDPLTYVGPAGWGAKGVSSAGRVAQVGKTGGKILKASRLEAIAGRPITDDLVRGFMEAGGLGHAELAAMRKAGKSEAEIADLVSREIGGHGQTNLNKWLSRIGGETESNAGLLGKADPFLPTDKPLQRQAAMDFHAKYGGDAKPGIRIGRARDPKTGETTGKFGVEIAGPGEVGNIPSGSTIAHIPFTDYGIHVPGFTQNAKYATALGPVLRAIESPISDPRVPEGLDHYEDIAQAYSELKDNYYALDALDKADVAAGRTPSATEWASTNPQLRGELEAQNIDLVQRIDGIRAKMEELLSVHEANKVDGLATPGDVLAYGRLSEAHDAAMYKFKADTEPLLAGNAISQEDYKKFRTLVGQRTDKIAAEKVANAEAIRKQKTDAYADTFTQDAKTKYDEANFLRQQGDAIAEPYKGVFDDGNPSSPIVSEIKSKPLTHVSGLGMGSNEFDGTYISTEATNRYAGPGSPSRPVSVNIKNPKVFESAGEYGAFREQFLPADYFTDSGKYSTDADMAAAGVGGVDHMKDAARAATEELKRQGYDSVYLRESPNSEGILVVFDKDKVNGLENTPAPGRDIPVSMQDGGVSGNAVEGSGAVGRVEPETGPATGSSPKARRARTEEFTRTGIKAKLEKEARAYEDATTDVYMDDADGVVADNWSGAFKGELPDEVLAYLKENPKDAKYFTANSPKGMGEDSLLKTDSSGVADLVAKIKNQGVTAAGRNRLELLRTDPSRPDAHFLFDLEDRLKGLSQRAKSDAKPALEPFSVVGGDGYRVMRGPKYGEYRAAQINEKTGKQKSYSKQRFTNIVDAILAHPPKDLQEILAQTKSARQRKTAVKDWIRTNKSVLANEIDNPPKIGSIRSPQLRVIDKPHDVLNVGTKFKTAGMDYRVSLAENGDKIIVDANNKVYQLGAFDSLPIDKDSLDLAEQIVPPPAIPDELAQFGQQADAFPSSTAFESEAAEAMRLRKAHYDLADKAEERARELMKSAKDIKTGVAQELHSEILGGANPNDPTTMANWNYLRQRYGEIPQDLLEPIDEADLRAKAALAAVDEEKIGVESAKWMLMESSPEKLDAQQKLADMLSMQLEAANRLSKAIQAPLLQTTTGTAQGLVKAAEMALGVDPGTIGANAFMPFAQAASGLMGDKFDAAARDLAYFADRMRREHFGERSGITHELVRRMAREMKNGGDTSRAVAAQVFSDAKRIMVANKIPMSDTDDFLKAVGLVRDRILHENSAIYAHDDEMWTGLKEIEKKGWFNDTLNPGLRAKIENMAQGLIEAEQKMGIDEQRAGLLGKLEEAHSSYVKTREAGEAINSVKANIPGELGSSLQDGFGKLVESFQQARTSFRQRVVGPDGKEIGSFVLGERDFVNGFNERDLEILAMTDPVMAREIGARKELIRTFDELGAADSLSQPHPERLSIHSINKLTEQGLYSSLSGGADMPRGFFETNPAITLASRTASHERSKIRLMIDQVANATGHPINKARLKNVINSGSVTKFLTDTGVEGRMIPSKNGSPAYYEIGNQRFRMIQDVEKAHDILGFAGSKLEGLIVPEHVAEAVENIYSHFKGEKEVAEVLKAIDAMTGVWKGVTLLHPSWTIGNISGAVIQMLSMGITPAQIAKYAWQTGKVAAHGHNPESLAKSAIEHSLGRETGAEMLKNMADGKVIQSGTAHEAMGHLLLQDGQMILPNQHSMIRNPKAAFLEMHANQMARQKAATYGGMMSRVPYHKQLGYMKGMVVDEVWANRVMKPWFGANGRVEDWTRMIAYAAMRDNGNDVSSATSKVIEGMFDFADLTKTETEHLRRLLPFYAWMRNSAAYGFKMLLENPKYHSLVPKVKEAVEEMFAGEQQVPEHARPRWMREQLAIQVGQDPEKRSAMLIGSYLPQEGGIRLASLAASPLLGQASLQDGISYLGMGINPLMRVPLEVAAGREFYTGRVIAGDENQGDLTVGEHLANQVRPFREFGVGQTRQGALPAAFERSFGEGVTRSLIGGRSQPFTEERLTAAKKREFDERVANIRKKINLAEREKKPEASLRARTALLQTYAEMKKSGAKIPKWAESQLVEVEN